MSRFLVPCGGVMEYAGKLHTCQRLRPFKMGWDGQLSFFIAYFHSSLIFSVFITEGFFFSVLHSCLMLKLSLNLVVTGSLRLQRFPTPKNLAAILYIACRVVQATGMWAALKNNISICSHDTLKIGNAQEFAEGAFPRLERLVGCANQDRSKRFVSSPRL